MFELLFNVAIEVSMGPNDQNLLSLKKGGGNFEIMMVMTVVMIVMN